MKSFRAELTIDHIGTRGNGVATVDGANVYVPATVPGDTVKVALTGNKDGHFSGKLLELLTPGPDRREPPCWHFTQCGGCALQHMTPDAYAQWKMALLTDTLARNGLDGAEIDPLQISPPGSRRRATFSIVRRKDDAIVGFNARASHQVIDLQVCPVVLPKIEALIAPLRDWAMLALRTGDTADIHVAMTDSGLDVLLRTVARIGGKGRDALISLMATQDLARVSRAHPRQDGIEILAEARPARLVFGDVPVSLSPGGFSQATADGEAVLTSFVLDAAKGAQTAADLYCGVGAFALPLAKAGCRVYAADIDKAAIANLAEAGRAAGLNTLRTQQRNLKRKPALADDLHGGDLVIFDPPRAGAKNQAIEIGASRVPRVIAVSCNPGTFARDARILVDAGYRLSRIQPVDQFLWSPHLELAARFDYEG